MDPTIAKGFWAGIAPYAARIGQALMHPRAAVGTHWRRQFVRERSAQPTADGPRVLLLTSSLGSGHVRAAQAIELALREHAPQPAIRTLDFWSLADDKTAWAARMTYLRLVEEQPALFDRIYRLDQRTWRGILDSSAPPPSSFAEVLALMPPTRDAPEESRGTRHPTDRVLLRLLCAALSGKPRGTPGNGRLLRLALVGLAWSRLVRRLVLQVRRFNPDVIVSTQMNPAALLSSARLHRGLDVPTIGVPTDFGVHDFWIQPGIDRYCVACDFLAELPTAGLDPGMVLATGIPLMPGFRNPPSMQQARQALDMDPASPTVLVAGGGLGLGVDAVVGRLLAQPGVMQIAAIVGRNAQALRSLAPLVARYGRRLKIREWTDQMELFIRAADVVVGKPGGLTVAEALACGRPLIAARSLGGQEGFNVRFLEAHGVGKLVAEQDLVGVVGALLSDPLALARMQERAWKLGRRDGAGRIAALVSQLAVTRSRQRIAQAR
ncbi:MAG: MGDG synthase family glycosyltransferase [Burkholderiales bacterium]